jgi:hypothetical protein
MDANFSISLISLIVSTATSLFVAYMTFVMMKFSAKPRIRVSLSPSSVEVGVDTVIRLTLFVENIGHWYTKPRATNLRIYWNFEADFELLEIRFGAPLDLVKNAVRRGKANSKYLKASGIHLSAAEPGEEVQIDVRTPIRPGTYHHWVSVFCDEGDCGVHKFLLFVRG